jgi:hypothetical protein
MATEYTTSTSVDDVMLNAAIETKILTRSIEASVLADKILNYDHTAPGLPISRTVPRWGAISVESVSESAEQESNQVTTDGVTITAAQYQTFARVSRLSSRGAVETFLEQLSVECGRAHAENFDTVGMSLATSLSTNVAGTSGVALTKDDVHNALFLLHAAKAPQNVEHESLIGLAPSGLNGYIMVATPAQVAHLRQSIGDSAAASGIRPDMYSYGDRVSAGYQFTWMNIPVFMTPNYATSDTVDGNGMLFSPAAFGALFVDRPIVQTSEIAGEAGIRHAVLSLFGIAELVDAWAVRLRSKKAI